ncbi:MAG: LysM peptidoglycan-binding domain-containing protein [Lachnospiraceae bacterium]|nr:LysM peptidoglycan-binding domain-containing protein [Lachnospiraceae bacterium]
MEIYIVAPGDTVDSIARSFSITADSIIYNNQIPYPYRLAIGQALLLSTGTNTAERQTVFVNGYAYPFISPFVLEETLPYLSDLSIFSYGFTTAGDLVPPLLDDAWMIELADNFSTRPILTLTPFGTDGRFNNNLISAIVNNPSAQENLINQLVYTVQTKGFRGVDIDFEFILPEDKIPFVEFVKNVQAAFSPFGYPVSVALAPKTSDSQTGLLYEGKDYGMLGQAADNVLLMTYEWGYTYGPPMAVAPVNRVREVVDYAITKIPREKINLGIPNYGYDWPLPFERGVTQAKTIGNVEAIQLAIAYNSPIYFDSIAMSPYFYYETEGRYHEVWFEDVRSLQTKFSLVEEYNLRGMGYWQIMQLFRANWLLLADTFWIRKDL